MWQLYAEQTDGCTISRVRNGREYRPPEFPNLRVDGFCAETRSVYEFFGCLFHRHNFLPFSNFTTLGGDNLAKRYELKMARLQQITSGGTLQRKCGNVSLTKTSYPTIPN